MNFSWFAFVIAFCAMVLVGASLIFGAVAALFSLFFAGIALIFRAMITFWPVTLCAVVGLYFYLGRKP